MDPNGSRSSERVDLASVGAPLDLQQVLDAFPYSVLIVDDDHRIVAANAALCDEISASRDELLGKPCPSTVHGAARFPHRPLGAAESSGESETREIRDETSGGWRLSSVYQATDANGRRVWVHTSLDITSLKQAQSRERAAHERLYQTLQATLRLTARAVEAKDPYTAGHQRRVARLSAAIAEALGVASPSVEAISMAASVHDLGKIGIPSEVLNKPGKLTDEEFERIRQHPLIGYSILEPIEFPWPIAAMVLQHHERLDGSGYPAGLSGDEIMPEAAIIAVADVVEAMSLDRPYRPALGVETALDILQTARGTCFRSDVVDACARLFAEGFALEGDHPVVSM